MLKILKSLGKYKRYVAVIIALLIVQAVCDLALPNYTSDLIDVGIQNGGFEYAVPETVSKDSYKAVQLVLADDELAQWKDAYAPDSDGTYTLKAGIDRAKLEKDFTQALAVYYMIGQADASASGTGAFAGQGADFSGADIPSLMSELDLTDSQFRSIITAILPAVDWDAVKQSTGLDKETAITVLNRLTPDTLKRLSAASKDTEMDLSALLDTSKLDTAAMLAAFGVDMKKPDVAALLEQYQITDDGLKNLVRVITPAIDMDAVRSKLGVDKDTVNMVLTALNTEILTKLSNLKPDDLNIAALIDFSKLDVEKLMKLSGSGNGNMDLTAMMAGLSAAEKKALMRAVLPAIDRKALSEETGLPVKVIDVLLDKLDTETLLTMMQGDFTMDLSTADLLDCIDAAKINYGKLIGSLGAGILNTDFGSLLSGNTLTDAEKGQVLEALLPAVDTAKLSQKTGMPEQAIRVFLENIDTATLLQMTASGGTASTGPVDFGRCIDYSKLDYAAIFAVTGTGAMPVDLSGMTDKELKTYMDLLLPAVNWQTVKNKTGFDQKTLTDILNTLDAEELRKLSAAMGNGANASVMEGLIDFKKVDIQAAGDALGLGLPELLERSGMTDDEWQKLVASVSAAVKWDEVQSRFGIDKETSDLVLSAATPATAKTLLGMADGTAFDTTALIDSNKIDTTALMNALNIDTSSLAAMMRSIPEGLVPVFRNILLPVRDMMNEKTKSLGASVLHSSAVQFAKSEYERIGKNPDSVQTAYLWKSGALMLAVTLVMIAASIGVGYLASKTGAGVGRDLRDKVFEKVVRFSSHDIDKFSTASLITRSTNDIQQVQFMMTMVLRILLYAPILSIGSIIMVARTGANMWWIVAAALGVIFAVMAILLVVTMPKFKRMQKLVDKVNLVSREILTGLPVIRAFGREKEEEERFDDPNRELTKTMLFVNRIMSGMLPLLMMGMFLLAVVIVWVSAIRIDAGTLEVGSMTAFITYALMIVIGFLMMTALSVVLPRAAVAAKRINEIIDTEPSVSDPVEAEEILEKKGAVAFHHVDFAYPGAVSNTLSDIHFTAQPGGTTAIIGSTGCGKSTLVSLIPRFYDVTAGEITVDGKDIRKLRQHDLREMIGYVPQKAVLFSGTIASNLRFGAPGANDEEIRAAAGIAQAEDFINEKTEQYEAPIAQGGGNVSGGQKQRLSIARAVAKKPKIYIFDDSFSALDFKTDIALRKALSLNMADSTVIIVAQRISTILHADQIVVLDEGRIAGIGTHRQLMETCEVYSQIAQSQLSQQEIDDSLAGKETI